MGRIALLTIACSCLAQVAPPKTHVEGRVINQAGKPLSDATVALVGNSRTPAAPLPPSYTTTSDVNGAFSFPDVEGNTYRLFAQRTGYLEFVFANPDGTVVIPVKQGDQKSIELKMTAQSFISGKITDADGEPFPGATVTVFRVNRMNGTRQRASNPIPAGADGNFSIGSLSAGRYYLGASSPPSLTQTNQREVQGNNGGVERYVTTYYPDAVELSAASPIEVAPGAELRGVDIRLRKSRVFHINGKVVNAAGASVSTATLTLRNPEVSDPAGGANRIFTVDGSFAINGLLPGVYTLQAQSGPTRELQGHQAFNITDRDINDAIMTLAPALEIPVSIQIADADPQQSQRIRSALRFTLTATDGTNDNAMAQTKADGWLFRAIGFGTYRMGLGVPDGTYVKSIRFGNADITTGLLDTTSGGGTLEMVLSPHAAEVNGVVHDANGQPLPGVAVTLWTPGLTPFGALDQARSTATDAMGHFRLGSVRPGEYRIAAWERIEQGTGNVAEFHVRFDNKATVVKLREDSRETVQPVLISRQEIETEASKLP